MTILSGHPIDRADATADPSVYRLDIMTQDDVPDVSRVERRCFPNPWPASAYRRELQDPVQNYYVVLRGNKGEEATSPSRAPTNGDAPGTNGDAARSLPRRSLLPLGLGRRLESSHASQDVIVGFAGMWLSFDEAHITTIGIDPPYRTQGLGEVLFLCMIDEAIARGANWLTLEVRVSNTAAQSLYRKYGFSIHGTRKRYYSDNNEDAHVMWSRALSDLDVLAKIEERRSALSKRMTARIAPNQLSPFAKSSDRAATS